MPARRRIGEWLVETDAISRDDLERALEIQRAQVGDARMRLGQLVVELGLVTEAKMLRALSLQLGLPVASLRRVAFVPELLARLPRALAERHTMVPVELRDEPGDGITLFVAMDDPCDLEAVRRASVACGLPVAPMLVSQADLYEVLRTVYQGHDPAWIERVGRDESPRPARPPSTNMPLVRATVAPRDPSDGQRSSSPPVRPSAHAMKASDGPRPVPSQRPVVMPPAPVATPVARLVRTLPFAPAAPPAPVAGEDGPVLRRSARALRAVAPFPKPPPPRTRT